MHGPIRNQSNDVTSGLNTVTMFKISLHSLLLCFTLPRNGLDCDSRPSPMWGTTLWGVSICWCSSWPIKVLSDHVTSGKMGWTPDYSHQPHAMELLRYGWCTPSWPAGKLKVCSEACFEHSEHPEHTPTAGQGWAPSPVYCNSKS